MAVIGMVVLKKVLKGTCLEAVECLLPYRITITQHE